MYKLLILFASMIVCFGGHAHGQQYPSRIIKVVVPYPAGGGMDIVGRLVLEKMEPLIGQRMILENRPGAASITGTDSAAKSDPDGYTLLLTASSVAVNATLFKQLPYDSKNDLIAIGRVAFHPFVLIVRSSIPAQTLAEFVAFARGNPNKVNFASVGIGSTQHLQMEFLKQKTGIEVTHVPYRGSAPAMQDLLGGQVDAMFNGISPTLAHIKAGSVRALVVDAQSRVMLLPDVPTLAESGIDGPGLLGWSGFFAPKGTPPEIVKQLNSALVAAVNNPDVQEKLKAVGIIPAASSPEELTASYLEEIKVWADLINKTGIPRQ